MSLVVQDGPEDLWNWQIAGSARLLDVLGVTSPTTADNAPGRQRLIEAYYDALEGREPGDDGPGS